MDLELGPSAGATPSATVSPPAPPTAQRKATYMKKGFNVKKKVKSTVVKTTAPATIIASTPTVPTSTHKSTSAQPERTAGPDFQGFKIPLRRRRLPSEVESSDSSDGCESTVSSMPEAPTTSNPWRDVDWESQLMRGGRARPRRPKHVTSTGADRPDSEPTPNKSTVRDTESVESLEPPNSFESMAKMMLEMRKQLMERKSPPRRHNSRDTHESDERRERYEEHSRSRGWRSRDEYRYPEELPRARRDR